MLQLSSNITGKQIWTQEFLQMTQALTQQASDGPLNEYGMVHPWRSHPVSVELDFQNNSSQLLPQMEAFSLSKLFSGLNFEFWKTCL